MILSLIFDVFITDTPLYPNSRLDNLSSATVAPKVSSYTYQNRMDITLYTLASYSILNFDFIYIFYELDDQYKDYPLKAGCVNFSQMQIL